MSITLQIQGATPVEVAEQLKGMFQQLLISQAKADGVLAAAPVEAPKEETKAEPAKETKPARAKKVEPKAESKPETQQAPDEPAPSLEDVRGALMRLSKAKGDDAVWNLLEKFEVKKASDVPEGKRAEVIHEIEQACAS